MTATSFLRPPIVSTLRSELSSVELCRRNGWGAGTILVGDPTPKDTDQRILRIQITGLGVGRIVAFEVEPVIPNSTQHWRKLTGSLEQAWDLHTREWRAIA